VILFALFKHVITYIPVANTHRIIPIFFLYVSNNSVLHDKINIPIINTIEVLINRKKLYFLYILFYYIYYPPVICPHPRATFIPPPSQPTANAAIPHPPVIAPAAATAVTILATPSAQFKASCQPPPFTFSICFYSKFSIKLF
jgi:hypothetical protein